MTVAWDAGARPAPAAGEYSMKGGAGVVTTAAGAVSIVPR